MPPAFPLQQHPAFARALRALGQRAEALEVEGGHALAVWRRLPVLGEVGYLPRGPVWDAGTTPERRAETLARLPVRLIEAEAPCPSLRAAGFRQVATPAHVAELDLSGGPGDLRARLHPKWRAALRQAERAPLRIREEAFRGEGSHWLLDQEASMRRERGYRALPPIVTRAFAHANTGAARLWIGSIDGEPVAAMLMLLHAPVASYHMGWSGERGRALSAHHRLLMAAADALARQGFARLDLGTVDTDAAPGLARFKIGTGAGLRALGGSWLRLPFARRGVALGRPFR